MAQVDLNANLSGSANISGPLLAQFAVAATPTASATVDATLTGFFLANVVSVGTATTSAGVVVNRGVAAVLAGAASIAGQIKFLLAAALDGATTLVGGLTESFSADAALSGSASVTSPLTAQYGAGAGLPGSATAVGSMTGAFGLQATLTGTSGFTAVPTDLLAELSGAASVSADLTANYDVQELQGDGSTVAASTSAADRQIGMIPAASSTANVFGGGVLSIPQHMATDRHKHILSVTGEPEGGEVHLRSMRWESTAAITQLVLDTDGETISRRERWSKHRA